MEKNCPFCNIKHSYIDNPMFHVIQDNYPVSKGHTLLIPKRHVTTILELTTEEAKELHDLVQTVCIRLNGRNACDGFNIGCNCGEAGGQTVMHAHLHVIPRYNGDVEDPRGGIRGVIPDKKTY